MTFLGSKGATYSCLSGTESHREGKKKYHQQPSGESRQDKNLKVGYPKY